MRARRPRPCGPRAASPHRAGQAGLHGLGGDPILLSLPPAKGVRKGSRAPRSRAAQVASANCFESPSPVGFGPSPSPYQPAGPPRSPPRAGYHSGAIGPTLADNLMQKFRYLKLITSPCELVWTSAQVQDTLVLITRRRCRRTEQRQRFPDFVLVIPRVGERKR